MYFILVLFIILFLFAIGKVALNPNNFVLHKFSLEETMSLRGLLAINILLCHLCPHFREDAPLLIELSYTIAVPCFFMFSGYGLAYSYWHKGEKYLDGFFKKRLLKLLWPLLFMSIIFQGWRLWHGLFEPASLVNNISPNSWFINALVIWYIGFYYCFKWGKNNVMRTNLNICFFTVIYMIITYRLGWKYYWIQILPMPIAIAFVPYEEKFRIIMREHTMSVLSFAFFITIIIMIYALFGHSGCPLPAWGPLMLSILPLMAFPLIYVLGGWKSRFGNLMGKYSYEFYIVHGFIVILLADTHWFGLVGYVNAIITLSVVFILTLLSAWVLNSVCVYINKRIIE